MDVAREELNLADIYAAQGHYSRALLLYNHSRLRFKRHGMREQAAEVAQHISSCLVRLNRAREAYELAVVAVDFFRSSPAHRDNLARALMHQATVAQLE